MTTNLNQTSSSASVSLEACLADTRYQLSHVINVSEEAANKTMDVVENLLEIIREQLRSSEEIQNQCRHLFTDPANQETVQQNSELTNFMVKLDLHSATMRKGLNAVMETQTMQDINRQVLNRVIASLGEIGKCLIDSPSPISVVVSTSQGEGPAINPNAETHCAEQDDVDDLLADMGL